MNNDGSAQSASKLDILKWIVVTILLLLGTVGYSKFSAVSSLWRILAVLVLLSLATYVAFSTVVGKKAWEFIQESHAELKRVVWPTKQEIIQTTIFVSIAVVLVALVLWLIDSMLAGALGWFVA